MRALTRSLALNGLDPRLAGFSFLAMIATGVVAAIAPKFLFAIVVAPIVVCVGAARPEFVLVLFLTAGLYKQHPALTNVFPFDATVCIASLLLVLLLVRFLRRPIHIPLAAVFIAPVILIMLVGIVAPVNAYGAEKALRFVGLTGIAMLSAVALLDGHAQMRRFLFGLALLGLVVSFSAVSERQTTEMGRLTLGGSSSINLGRIGTLALVFGWLRFHFSRSPFGRAAAAAMVVTTLFCVLNSGSRGPVVSATVSMLMVSLVTARFHRKSPVGMLPLITLAAIVAVLVSLVSLPYIPLYRFQLLFSEHKGASVVVRGLLFATAWKLMLSNPLGIGAGGFEKHAPLDYNYPHNLFLEVGSELGWVPLVGIVALTLWSMWTAFQVVKREYSWQTLFLAIVLLTTFLNSMVSGDLNDNRMFFSVLFLPFVYSQLPTTFSSPRPRHGVVDTGRTGRT